MNHVCFHWLPSFKMTHIIQEESKSNRFDGNDHLISTCKYFDKEIATNTANKLEVIAIIDRYKDYGHFVDEVIDPSATGLSPKPENNAVSIELELYDMDLASLISTKTFTIQSNIISVFENQLATFDLANFTKGNCAIQLAVDGILCDQE